MPKIGSAFPVGGLNPAQIAAEGGLGKVSSKPGDAKFEEILNSAGALASGGTKGAHAAKMEKAATDFEALLLQEMLKSMWSAGRQDDILASGDEDTYRDMLHQALAQNIAETQSIGVKDVLLKDLIKNDKQ